MSSIIVGSRVSKNSVSKYNFKSLDLDDENDEFVETSFYSEPQEIIGDEEVDTTSLSVGSKDSLIESLLKKTDEMSSNFIKLQMKLESMVDEHKVELEQVKKASFDDGVKAGQANAAANDEKKLSGATEQFFDSIAKLQSSAKEFEEAIGGIKGELVGAAVDIAREVVKVEVSENSSTVAGMLADELIAELQKASKITLKVSPKDHGYISQKMGELANITVVSDGAISPGGVIAISDVGNIDAQVFKRFERVKRAALGEI